MRERGLSRTMYARGKTATRVSMVREFGVARGSSREVVEWAPFASERGFSRAIRKFMKKMF